MSLGGEISRTDIVGELRQLWASIAEVTAQLDQSQWLTPTRCPGWSVQDIVSHMVGTESILAGRPPPDVTAGHERAPHVRNDLGALNEASVAERRHRPGVEVHDEFVAITDERLVALERMAQSQFDEEAWTPVGLATYGRFMRLRLFDCWVHEQDIREALGRPGHLDGPVVDRAMDEIGVGLCYVIAKLAKAPKGSTVALHISAPHRRRFDVVVEQRARLSAQPMLAPTASLALSLPDFVALVAGRADLSSVRAEGTLKLAGSIPLAERIAENLAYVI